MAKKKNRRERERERDQRSKVKLQPVQRVFYPDVFDDYTEPMGQHLEENRLPAERLPMLQHLRV